jgi:hypothetical protein
MKRRELLKKVGIGVGALAVSPLQLVYYSPAIKILDGTQFF